MDAGYENRWHQGTVNCSKPFQNGVHVGFKESLSKGSYM